MSFYWFMNTQTGVLVYSNASTYDDGSGNTWLPLEQTNMTPTNYSDWAFYSHSSSIVSVGWDESNGKIEGLTSMYYMFYNCTSLTALDLSGFDTSQIMYLSGMFQNCKSLTFLDLSGFDTSKVTDMSYMFSGCTSLTSLDLSGFDTSQTVYMTGMFKDCSFLTCLDLSGFDTSKVGKGSMFSRCSSLRILAVSGSMSNVLSRLPADQYYPAAGGAATAKADLTAGTWIRDAGDLSVCTSLVDLAQARMALSRSVTKLAKRIAKMQ